MSVISYKAIREFVSRHSDAASSLAAWYKTAKKAAWRSLAEVREQYRHADVVGELTVFNIRGNHYRLIAYVDYKVQTIFIKHILTHEEYDEDKWKP